MFKSIIVLCVLALAIPAYAYRPPTSTDKSAVMNSDTVATDVAGYLYGIICANDGSNNWTLDLHNDDGTATAAAAKLIPSMVQTTSATNRFSSIGFETPLEYDTGVWFNVTGDTPGSCIIYYREK